MTTQTHDDETLFWQACQYVQGDLSATEEESFEERLATDQAAREAVALAAEVHNAIHAACAWDVTDRADRPTVRSAPAPARRLQWVVGILAATVLGMLTWMNVDRPGRQAGVQSADRESGLATQTDPELALLWAQQLEAEPSLTVPAAEEPSSGEPQVWEDSDESDAGWMWLAISDADDEADEPEGLDDSFDQPLEESL